MGCHAFFPTSWNDGTVGFSYHNILALTTCCPLFGDVLKKPLDSPMARILGGENSVTQRLLLQEIKILNVTGLGKAINPAGN